MKRLKEIPGRMSRIRILSGTLLTLLLAMHTFAQTPSRLIGTIATIHAHTLTVKPDAGDVRSVEVPESAVIKRIAAGEHDLSKAEPLPFAELAVGDRVLMRLDASAQATQIIAIKQEDLAQKQQREREEWQKHGVGGLVKNIDPTAGEITISSGFNGSARIITIHVAKSTLLKRYALASVRYDTARPASIDAIHAGDQLRARGEKSADGSSLTAEEVISGSFRNISGVIATIDPAAQTVSLKDLVTKKPVTLAIPPDAQIHRLPNFIVQLVAARSKDGYGAAAPAHAPGMDSAPHPGQWPGAPGGVHPPDKGTPDLQQLLTHLPQIPMSDLKKGDAIMAVTTEGTDKATAITLLAGVESLLAAPAAQDLLANWSMGGGDSGQ